MRLTLKFEWFQVLMVFIHYLQHHFICEQIAARLGVANNAVQKVIIWGNHSSTQFPDVRHATVNIGGKTVLVPEAIKDDSYLKNDFVSVSLGKWFWCLKSDILFTVLYSCVSCLSLLYDLLPVFVCVWESYGCCWHCFIFGVKRA